MAQGTVKEGKTLVKGNLTAFFDVQTHLISYHFEKIVTPSEISAIPLWVKAQLEDGAQPSSVRGSIFDFRNVKKFSIGSTPAAKETSQEGNELPEVNMVPLVYLVRNVQQEVTIRMSRVIGLSRPGRRAIFYTQEQALDFINEWNEKHNRTLDVPADLLNIWPGMVAN
ncbi:MAG: hypothetical protein AAF902_15835 [Chloroflexota bacterium]